MNLDELKILWDSQEQGVSADRVSRDEVLALLEGKGKSALGRINRNILIEMGVVALFGILWILMLLSKATPPSGLEIGSVFLYVVLSALFYSWKFSSLNAAKLEGKNLKSALQHTVKVMRRFMRIYYWAGWVLVPLFVPIGLLYGVVHDGLELSEVPTAGWIRLGIVAVVFTAISIVFVKWYVQKLYGKHYKVLQGALSELEEEA